MDEYVDFVYKNIFLANDKNSSVYLFVSGAEQTGSTWVSLSLAHAINNNNKKVLIVDGNGNLSNISSYLGIKNENCIERYISGKSTLNQNICAYKNKNFNLLTAISGNKYITSLPMGRYQIFIDDLQILSKNYDFTFIDIGIIKKEYSLNLYQIARNIIICCSENSADLAKTFEIIKFVNEANMTAKCKMIINKVNSFEDGYKIYEKLNKASERNGLKFPELLGIIRADARIRDTIKNKELLLNRYPESEAAIDICEIVEKIKNKVTVE